MIPHGYPRLCPTTAALIKQVCPVLVVCGGYDGCGRAWTFPEDTNRYIPLPIEAEET